MIKKVNDGSFRDPSGFVFESEGKIFRQVNPRYQKQYDLLMSSGLYKELVEEELLIPHKEVSGKEWQGETNERAYKVLEPEKIPFISYPYEWSFSQLKDAARTTLNIQKRAIKKGLTLKDASAYNIQFYKGKPMLIDTLSFEILTPGEPWVAYKQFCQHFLAPLLLQSVVDVRLSSLLKTHLDGIPLDLASKLLPLRSKCSFGVFSHIVLHAKSQARYGGKAVDAKKYKMGLGETALLGVIESLSVAVEKTQLKLSGTEWDDYYSDNNNYNSESAKAKREFVQLCVKEKSPKIVWDVGANDGEFSEIATKLGCFTVSLDIDPVCVERNYVRRTKAREKNILPLIGDVTNPSPGIGWNCKERSSLVERGPADMVFALALIHHLAISNNVPLFKIAEFFSKSTTHLVIEFVPKTDSQVKKLLASREDIFDAYDVENFEKAFSHFFEIKSKEKLTHAERIVYLMSIKK